MTEPRTTSGTQPICLLADSQLLFDRDGHTSCLSAARLRVSRAAPRPLVVYIGASNGDAGTYYELFEAAAESAGFSRTGWVRAAYDRDDAAALEQADVIVLAGGDVRRGLDTFRSTPMARVIAERHAAGAALIGISAGAVQLGCRVGARAGEDSPREAAGLGFVPFVIGAHEERDDWQGLSRQVQAGEGRVDGVGMALGGGMMYYPEHRVEAIRLPLHHFRWRDGGLHRSLWHPPATATATTTNYERDCVQEIETIQGVREHG